MLAGRASERDARMPIVLSPGSLCRVVKNIASLRERRRDYSVVIVDDSENRNV